MAILSQHRYLLITLDPVHIGTGGYRLGRVDNSIVREPGTQIPKVPGSSLHGALRTYTARLINTPEAAGQKHDKVKDPDRNPVCYAFGYIKKDESSADEVRAYSGVVNVFDARILLFPVNSMHGPVWVSTVGRLRDAGFEIQGKANEQPQQEQLWLTWQHKGPLNLGWMMLEPDSDKVSIEAPDKWKEDDRWKRAKEKVVMVHEKIFAHVVNSNLEVRTSVSIDPKTGAAEEGALFSYEAIPRATFLTMEVVVDDYRQDPFPDFLNDKLKELVLRQENSPISLVELGLKGIEYLGVGGMGTRGFGRMAIVGNASDEVLDVESNDAPKLNI